MARIEIDLDVEIAMRDGTILRADIWRPDRAGPHPTLLQRFPYDKRAALASVVFAGLEPIRAAAAGFAVVIQDSRGRFASDGTFTPFTQEANDGADTVAWIASQGFSNGRVGMYGVSYGGATQLLAASRSPRALRAIAPHMTGADPYCWFYEGGAFRLGFALWWAANSFARTELARRGATSWGDGTEEELDAIVRHPWSAFRHLPLTGHGVLDRLVPAYSEWLAHPTRDDYWAAFPTPESWGRPSCPALHVGGWDDLFLRGTLRNHAALGGSLVVGPWAHAVPYDTVGEVEYGPDAAQAAIDLNGLQLDWFRRHLAGEQVAEQAPVRLFFAGINRWRDESEWPPARAKPTVFHLRSGGRLSNEPPGADEPADTFSYDPRDPVPTVGGATFLPGLYVARHAGPRDQSAVATRPDVLTYMSEPFGRPTEIVGDLTFVLHAATSAADTDWTAKVVLVDVHGIARGLADGIVRARYRDGTGAARPIDPGSAHEVVIDVGAKAVVVAAGARIGVQISSSNFPKYDRNPNHGGEIATATERDFVVARQTVFHDAARPSRLILPIVR